MKVGVRGRSATECSVDGGDARKGGPPSTHLGQRAEVVVDDGQPVLREVARPRRVPLRPHRAHLDAEAVSQSAGAAPPAAG